MPIGSQAIARTAIFGTCARRKLCDDRENGTVGTVSVVLPTYYLMCMGRMSVPPLVLVCMYLQVEGAHNIFLSRSALC